MTEKSDAAMGEVKLPSEMDLLSAEGLRDTLLNVLNEDKGLLIDASDVERVSTPCIEVLVAAQKSCAEAGYDFKISNSSQILVEAFSALGLDEYFKGWRAIQ